MQAFVAGVEYEDRERQTATAKANRAEAARLREEVERVESRLANLVPKAKSGAVRPAVNARRNVDRFDPIRTRSIRFTILATNNLEPCIDELEAFGQGGHNPALASDGARVTSSGDNVTPDRHELRLVNDGRYGNSSSWMSNEMGKGWLRVDFQEEEEIDRVVWGRDRKGEFGDRLATEYRIEAAEPDGSWRLLADSTDRARPGKAKKGAGGPSGLSPDEEREAARLKKEKGALERRIAEALVGQTVFAGRFRTPDTIRLLTRGDPEQPRETVVPAVPAVLGDLALKEDAPEQDRRAALADWIVRADHPLTARVAVNRVWHTHFGTGLVDTPSDFGRNGTLPSHPELLDWLAGEFVAGGWSLKKLHREIVLSATYGQSTRVDPAAAAKDADVRLFVAVSDAPAGRRSDPRRDARRQRRVEPGRGRPRLRPVRQARRIDGVHAGGIVSRRGPAADDLRAQGASRAGRGLRRVRLPGRRSERRHAARVDHATASAGLVQQPLHAGAGAGVGRTVAPRRGRERRSPVGRDVRMDAGAEGRVGRTGRRAGGRTRARLGNGRTGAVQRKRIPVHSVRRTRPRPWRTGGNAFSSVPPRLESCRAV